MIPQLHPDIVFLAQHGYDDATIQNKFNVPGIGGITSDEPEFEPTLQSMSTYTLQLVAGPRPEDRDPRTGARSRPPVPLVCLSQGGSVA